MYVFNNGDIHYLFVQKDKRIAGTSEINSEMACELNKKLGKFFKKIDVIAETLNFLDEFEPDRAR